MRPDLRTLVRVWVAGAVLLAVSPAARAQQQTPLTQLQFDIVGLRLQVDPPALTVPKGIATQINTSIVTPGGATTATQGAIDTLAETAFVEGEIRGPAIPPTPFRVRPGQPIPVPAFALPGDYFLDNVRLVKDGQPLLDATATDGRNATTIPIKVINEILVTSVTSRPLSLDEIREKGIVIDEANYKAVNFQVAFNIDGAPFTIQLPVAMPTPELLQAPGTTREQVVANLASLNRQLAESLTKLPEQFDRPGLNFSIAALPFIPVLEESEEPGFSIPPVTGLIVIPGNVAFLNQFFSVILTVGNVAPDGTPLVLRDVAGTITLPTGLDRVAGSFQQPGDDPLRLARIEGIGLQPTIVVAQVGADGKVGTADDIPFIPPQKSGDGEFLVEGLKEGGHLFDIQIDATLEGLPNGPVKLTGKAAGAVFVRNPTFSVTLAHPRTVRSGERYDVYATVYNTSQSDANLVSVNLDPAGLTGTQLVSDPTVAFESLPAGQSATAKFTFVSQRTGEVTATSFTGETGGGIQLTTGVGERGIPLSPNAIVLPTTTNALPASLVAAAQRVLGQAFSIATAPAQALPPGVLFVKRNTVVTRGQELGEAGQRIEFGEPAARVIKDLLLDWIGNRAQDPGFDQLLRTTDAGRAFLDEIGLALGAAPATALDLQAAFGESTVARAPHLSVVAQSSAGADALRVRIVKDESEETGETASGLAQHIVSGAYLGVGAGGAGGELAIAGVPQPARYRLEATAVAPGSVDIGALLPGAVDGELRQVLLSGLSLAAGGVVRIDVDLTTPGVAPTVTLDSDGDGRLDTAPAPTSRTFTDGPPAMLAVRQLASSFGDQTGSVLDPASYGLLVAALFDRPVTEASAEQFANYTIGNNAVIGAQLQQSGRLVFLYLQKPVGGIVQRSLTAAGVVATRGGVLPSTTLPIVSTLTDGGRVFGQARKANGQGVPGAVIELTVIAGEDSFTVARIAADASGAYDFEFVPRIGDFFVLRAQDVTTLDVASTRARVRGAGEQMLVNVTFTGKGAIRGRVVSADGVTPVPGIPVAVIPGGIGERGVQASTDALGEFFVPDVGVGPFAVRAVDPTGAFGTANGVIPAAGDTAEVTVVTNSLPDTLGRLVGRVFLADGATPASGFTVLVGSYDREKSLIRAVDQTVSDVTGSFAFSVNLPATTYDVVAVDPATQQLGMVKANVVARTSTSVVIVLESTGAVEGVVFDAIGQVVAGALVAGGTTLATTDGNGFFRIEGVPAGSRVIQAGNPVTRRRGSITVDVVPGQTVRAQISLEARATITGLVLDAAGRRVPKATVRIPSGEGYTVVIANNQGVYSFPDLPLGSYLIQAPGPSEEAMKGLLEANGYDICSAYTSGDCPDAPSTPPSTSDPDSLIKAYQEAVTSFFSINEDLFSAVPIADLGGFGWTRVELFQDSITETVNVVFLPQGTVSGRTEDGGGRPTGALVRVRALQVDPKGFPVFLEQERKQSDAATGAFSFGRIARYDETTFQRAGVRGGEFTIEAAQQFSPVIASYRGQLSTATPDLTGIVVRFPSATETNGTVSGRVVMPDGATPAPAGTVVRISFGDLQVTTGADGRFVSQLPIPSSVYNLTAQTPTGGLRGETRAVVPAGGNVDVEIRLLGLGTVDIVATRPGGVPVPNAVVRLERGTFPSDRADGSTDGNGTLRFTGITEGVFSVVVEERNTGLTGRGSGTVIRDGTVTANVVITASGRVTGTFVTASAGQPIPFAQVTLRTSQGVEAFASTDVNGRFEMLAVPVGSFTISAYDPNSGRQGAGAGQLTSEGQVLDVTVAQVPVGTVTGRVLNGDGAAAVAGARVSLRQGSAMYQATTVADGEFRFAGISQGAFTLDATDPQSGFPGTAAGRLSTEGEVVEVNVTLQPFGTVVVTVRDEQDTIVTNANVLLVGSTRQGVVDANGRVTFENLAIDKVYRAVATSLAVPQNGGSAPARLTIPNQVLDVTVKLRGTAPLTVSVRDANGVPAASARVTAEIDGLPGLGADTDFATTVIGFTLGNGEVTFPAVPLGDIRVKAESGPLAGYATGVATQPATAVRIEAQLGASGSLSGRVLLPDGSTPATQALVTLKFNTQSVLQSGTQQLRTGVDGRFAFSNIPLGTVTVDAFDVVTNGVRRALGSLVNAGQQLDLGDLVLDNTSPLVTAVSPEDNAAGVSPSAQVAVTFSEPIDPSTLVAGADPNFVVTEGNAPVAGRLEFSDGNRTVAFVPSQPLRSGARYTVSIKGAPDGPKDTSGLVLQTAFVSGFTVRDVVPPAVTAIFPAAGAMQVVPEAVVRVTFSEPLAGVTLTLRDAANQAVAGTVSLTAGNTVAVFSPTQFLLPNTFYTASVSAGTDLAGNPLSGVPATATFATVDTLAPIIAALQLTGAPRAGTPVSITPQLAAADVQRVEYAIEGAAPAVVTTAPFTTTFVVPSGVAQTSVTAVAVDLVGNRSIAASLPIAILANQAPAVSLVNVNGVTSVGQGDTVAFDVVANDDEGVASIRFTAGGAAALVVDRAIPGAPASTTQRFTVTIPATASSVGALNVQAAAFDGAGAPSTPASLSIPLRDGQRPSVTIVGPSAGTEVAPGGTLVLVVDVADDIALASVQVSCTPATLTGCETRALSGTSSRQTFTLGVPADLAAPLQLSLVISATDAAGNVGTAGRSLALSDTVPPAVTSLATVNGATRVLEGETVSIRANVTDNVALQAVTFTATSGAFTTTQNVAVSGTSAQATFNLAVPTGLGAGAQLVVNAVARDAANVASQATTLTLTVGDTAPPTVEILLPAVGAEFQSGGSIVFRARGTDDTGVKQLEFRATGAVPFAATVDVTVAPSAEEGVTIPIPTAAVGGVTLSVRSVDAAGNASGVAERAVTVADRTAPDVLITGPLANAEFDPRNPITVTASASDNVAVGEVSLTRFDAGGTATLVDTRAVQPPSTPRSETFTFTVPVPSPTATTLRLRATARDAAGNTGASSDVTITLTDVVAPAVSSTSPADGATGVDLNTEVSIAFSEPMNPATLTAATVVLRNGGTDIPATVTAGGNNASVLLTPQSRPLPVSTLFTVALTGLRDAAGNALPDRTFSFRTASPDSTGPKVSAVEPANNSVGVGGTAPITVTFTEAVEPVSVNAASFKVSVDGTAVPGVFAFLDGSTKARFTPTTSYGFEKTVVVELTGAIRDVANNALVNDDGSAVTTPITFTFLTGNFALTKPAGTTVVEKAVIEIAAEAGGSLTPVSVVFSVNGVALPADTAAPFSVNVTVPAVATTRTLVLVASARDAGNAGIARAEKTVTVVPGLEISPTLLGLPRGATRQVRLSIAEPADADLAIVVSSGDSAVATVAPPNVSILAGQTTATVNVTACTTCPVEDPSRGDEALGNTSVIAASSRGTVAAVVSVSDPVAGRSVTAFQQAGVAISQAPSLGQIALPAGRTLGTLLTVLGAPASASTPVTVFSSNPAVATASGSAVQPGAQTTTLTIESLADGVTQLAIRAGDEVRSLTVVVGNPGPNQTPPVVAQPIGMSVIGAPSVGQLVLSSSQVAPTQVSMLTAPLAGPSPLPVTVSSNNPTVATGTATPIQPGSQSTTLTVTALADGTAVLTLRAGDFARSVTIVVGTPLPNQTAPVMAQPVGANVVGLPFIGKAFVPMGQGLTLGVLFLTEARGTPTIVTVTSNNVSVAAPVVSQVTIPAGELTLPLQVTSGAAGTARLRLDAGDIAREFEVVVGSDPTPTNAPVVAASPVGVSITPLPGLGRIAVSSGTPVTGIVGVQVVTAASASDRTVTVSSSNAAIVAVGSVGTSSTTVTLPAGSTVLPLTLVTSGATGTAVVTIEIDGERRELLVVVGDVPASMQPAIVAPVVGVKVG